MTDRMPGGGSKLMVGDVNEWLDVLVDFVKDKFGMTIESRAKKSIWQKSLQKAVASKNAAKKYKQICCISGKADW
jgi:hypothetical protein